MLASQTVFGNNNSKVFMQTVVAKLVSTGGGYSIPVRILFDSGSQKSYFWLI